MMHKNFMRMVLPVFVVRCLRMKFRAFGHETLRGVRPY